MIAWLLYILVGGVLTILVGLPVFLAVFLDAPPAVVVFSVLVVLAIYASAEHGGGR